MADNRFSLTRVRLRYYRSIASADVSLGDLLLLVGPNGSGKSNFLDALRLTSESLQTSLDQALRSRGEDPQGAYGFEVGAVRGGGFRIAREYCDVWFDSRASEGERYANARFSVVDGELDFATEPVMPPVPGPGRAQQPR